MRSMPMKDVWVWLALTTLLSIVASATSGTCPCRFPINDEGNQEKIDQFLSGEGHIHVCGDSSVFAAMPVKRDSSLWTQQGIRLEEVSSGLNSTQLHLQGCHVLLRIVEPTGKGAPSNVSPQFPLFYPGQCPEHCSDHLPILEITKSQINSLLQCSFSSSADECLLKHPSLQYLSCTLDFVEGIWKPWKTASYPALPSIKGKRSFVVFAFTQLVWRRWLECSEYLATRTLAAPVSFRRQLQVNISESKWTPLQHHERTRRAVFMVIVWVGSLPKYQITQKQMDMLSHITVNAKELQQPKVILPWAATDNVYPCKMLSTRCLSSNKKYGGLLTQSAVNFMPPGWGCAQRRPLRSIAHILSLVDPQYLIILDDDSAFNMPKFLLETLPRLEQSVHGFLKEPVVLGELLGRTGDRGHLSKLSLFVGGSGYIMNKPLLQALHARVLPLHNGTALKQKLGRFGKSILPALHATMDTLIHDDLSARESVVGSNDHWRLLSVFVEGVEAVSSAEEECTTSFQCMHDNESKDTIGLGVRLVDFCANLMANEHTCQHSDHSMGRCLLYAATALPINTVCVDHTDYKSFPATTVSDAPFWMSSVYQSNGLVDGISGMCFAAPTCDPMKQLSCHRYIYSGNANGWSAQRLMPQANLKHGYYKVFTSTRNGTVYDTQMP